MCNNLCPDRTECDFQGSEFNPCHVATAEYDLLMLLRVGVLLRPVSNPLKLILTFQDGLMKPSEMLLAFWRPNVLV